MSFLQASGISHAYFSKNSYNKVLENVDFSMERGEFVGFVGASGCGKTTMLHLLAGLEKPTMGTVVLEGEQLHKPTAKIGYMLQQDYLLPWRSIYRNVSLGADLHKVDESEKVNMLLEKVGLSESAQLKPAQLSGGMRQRAALARTLVRDPALLLLDEPFSALDFQTKLELEDYVWQTLRAEHKAMILVTHDLEEAIAMCDRICIFSPASKGIVTSFTIPTELRTLLPFAARQTDTARQLFARVWKELYGRD
ncbi:MAG: ABC transporter ATP-binding protein [Bacilli bacterium]